MNSHTSHNPCGLNGFAFLEFSGLDQPLLHQRIQALGFQRQASHDSEPIDWYQQHDIQLILNGADRSQAKTHAEVHGAGVCAMGFFVEDVEVAYAHALRQGATAFVDAAHADHGLPAIEAIGGSVIYFVDRHHQPFMGHWKTNSDVHLDKHTPGLIQIDHLTHNVHRGHMDKWAQFYESIFQFKEIRFFNIVGQHTGLVSRALESPCAKIKIPLNESTDERSQIEEFLHEYHGEGIQHIAFSTANIYHTVSQLRANGIPFLDVPETYYEAIHARIPWHQEPLDALREWRILIDGEADPSLGLLLQIFTENTFGPVFFEIIQRRGHQGFGEGNFQALFEAIERDQIRRGTL